MKHYLDELLASPDPTSAATREETKERGPKDWFPYAEDVKADLGMCFGMWDAVSFPSSFHPFLFTASLFLLLLAIDHHAPDL